MYNAPRLRTIETRKRIMISFSRRRNEVGFAYSIVKWMPPALSMSEPMTADAVDTSWQGSMSAYLLGILITISHYSFSLSIPVVAHVRQFTHKRRRLLIVVILSVVEEHY